ncbi:V-type proton ATPase subunit D, putative [Plasmodium vinckei vinckei]|uniref:V-type ATPase, D subunit n=4 Tax=Plasmodium vinckei TaxID=5860 RepID=W7AJ33_PLAVN|nr:V-type proton ATPase subunit D, putative [Plasmodium vinckei vinckei]EUD71730.1 V-type ATPase, D subunit [Plasmodium vinckei petteri]CAD2102113.1 V-type proton ATPase subunit D, putative [Plasmodium vinckei brucechwatti]CAD2102223.1 V-type proton ATPase subunit D, putative [Plasmodium vinckei lentum]KEG04989.1 V-type ATPase, D subunit [Plasmodium vinckei vinckei]CAD2098431.1 V-type proton ATPase subunit D, putative [Plasmodium vinckei petteri]
MGALDESTPVPSRITLHLMKQKKKSAFQGYSLLKKKSDALFIHFRDVLKDIVKTKNKVGEDMRNASFALAKSVWAAGDFKGQIIEGIKRPVVTLSLSTNNVAGVKLPIFQVHIDPTVDVLGNLGVAAGGQVINNTRENYLQCLNMLVKLASMQVAFFSLDEEIKMTNRRVNALNNIVLPRLEGGINYIIKELDEIEREEFYRLKKIKEKKTENLNDATEDHALPDNGGHKHVKVTNNYANIQADDDVIF